LSVAKGLFDPPFVDAELARERRSDAGGAAQVLRCVDLQRDEPSAVCPTHGPILGKRRADVWALEHVCSHVLSIDLGTLGGDLRR
jgi:hypothetical protein